MLKSDVEEEIEKLKEKKIEISETGTVLSVGDGVARVLWR
jgi:F0F1-type ATP synthase alpha subunit